LATIPSVFPASVSNITALPPAVSFFASPLSTEETVVHLIAVGPELSDAGVVEQLEIDLEAILLFSSTAFLFTVSLAELDVCTFPLCPHVTLLLIVRTPDIS
jgi:hypothetical protein